MPSLEEKTELIQPRYAEEPIQPMLEYFLKETHIALLSEGPRTKRKSYIHAEISGEYQKAVEVTILKSTLLAENGTWMKLKLPIFHGNIYGSIIDEADKSKEIMQFKLI